MMLQTFFTKLFRRKYCNQYCMNDTFKKRDQENLQALLNNTNILTTISIVQWFACIDLYML